SGLDRRAQRIDYIAQRLGRPSSRLHESAQRLSALQHRMQGGVKHAAQRQRVRVEAVEVSLPKAVARAMELQYRRLQTCETSLGMLDPHLVLERGYAYLSDAQGVAITHVGQSHPGQAVVATLADGQIGLTVDAR
ncbi:MAG: exodeoxyribonuclease VII large subunit, partial [Hydrogenophaga sp.]|nr:exodeoxyribonuclease VII large subunit [Hydrogenophaga sp.]